MRKTTVHCDLCGAAVWTTPDDWPKSVAEQAPLPDPVRRFELYDLDKKLRSVRVFLYVRNAELTDTAGGPHLDVCNSCLRKLLDDIGRTLTGVEV